MNKPIICFLIGYIPDLNNKGTNNTYGSEISLLNLSKQLINKYRVIVFGQYQSECILEGVEFSNIVNFENFQKENSIDIIVISRYIFHFIDHIFKARKIFILLQDIHVLPFYKDSRMPNEAKGFVKNVEKNIDGFVTLTNWHKEFFQKFYEIDPNKVYVIGNAIDVDKFKIEVQKQKNKFIWTSHGGRGFYKLMEYFHEIRKRISDAELYVYRDESAFMPEEIEEMKKYDYIHYGGRIDNDKVIEEFQSSDIWFYPTDFDETYCISAVEAQMAKCVCIATDKAALKETISNRGILISEPIWSEEYKEKCINEIERILNNEELKKKYQNIGYEWAKEQNWKNRVEEWYRLFQ